MKFSNHRLVVSCIVATSSVAIAGALLYHYTIRSQSRKRSISSKKEPKDRDDYPPEIKEELLSRVSYFFGPENASKLENAFVIVVGLGGVGSHAANMLCRSGVGKMRLIDFDQVTLSSLNRHAVASMADVGIAKAEIMRKRLLQVVPWCDISAVTEMFKGDQADHLLSGNPTYVLDCIDDVSTKADLIAYCIKNNISILTSMGAGGKSDPTRLRIAALSDSIHDPLASKIRWKLKKHGVCADDVMSIFSLESPVCDLVPLDDEQAQAPQDFGVVDYMRLRVMPVLGTSPSIFGQAMASFVLCAIAGRPYYPEACERLSKNLKHKMRQAFRNNELRRFKTTEDIDMDDDDVEFIVAQVWRSRCAVTGRKFGGHSTLVLTRWAADQLPVPHNLVLLMPKQAQLLEDSGQSAFDAAVVQKINERLAWAKRVCSGSWESYSASPLPAVAELSPTNATAASSRIGSRAAVSIAQAEMAAWQRAMQWLARGTGLAFIAFGCGYAAGSSQRTPAV